MSTARSRAAQKETSMFEINKENLTRLATFTAAMCIAWAFIQAIGLFR
jgi:hypothetical protein